jgi:hypothetical protein
VATRKPKDDTRDFNSDVPAAVRKIAESKRIRGEDLISDPKFRDIEKQAKR